VVSSTGRLSNRLVRSANFRGSFGGTEYPFLPSRQDFWGVSNPFPYSVVKDRGSIPSSYPHDTHAMPEIVLAILQNYRKLLTILDLIYFY
jgi:hypothetical protein